MALENEVFDFLYNLGACNACCLRYLCIRKQEVFENEVKYIEEHKYLTPENLIESSKQTKNCLLCLGLLQDSCINETVDKIVNNKIVKSYDSKVFTVSLSYPPSVQIREHSIKLNFDSKFPDYINSEKQEIQINKAWKWKIKNKVAEKLKKNFEESDTCNFSINVQMQYDLDTEELQVLPKMNPDYFKKREIQHRKFKGELFSRKGVMDVLSQIKSDTFKEHDSVPPLVPQKAVYCGKIECSHNSIFFAGRYNKYSRELPQTPWIINGLRQMESSVQEIIFEPLQTFLNISEDGMKFSASGREDVDVRCLGNGRPFYIEYLNPKTTQITFEQFRRIENEINKSEDVKVRDLQIVSRDELSNIKDGEESKTKSYKALCISAPIVKDENIQLLNVSAPLTIKQKTPLRVLHRRPLAVRNKTIHCMKATPVKGDSRLFEIEVTTQAGTYVKEFVHGDFGRTVPSIDTLFDGSDVVDIVTLDVTAVNLDWPKSVIKPDDGPQIKSNIDQEIKSDIELTSN